MDDTIKKILEIVTDIQEDVTDIRTRMATKDGLEAVRYDLQVQIIANTKAIAQLGIAR